MSKVSIQLDGVQETLLIPLWGRARENSESNPILIDRYASEFLSRIDYDFSAIERKYRDHQNTFTIRGYTFDKVIRRFLADHPNGTIINLGAGLDTTFFRIDNGTLRWYDLDLPDVIALRRRFITETDRLQFIAASVLDISWFDKIAHHGSGVLILGAGLFMYFNEAEIRALFSAIQGRFPGAQMMFDVFRIITPRYRRIGVRWRMKGRRHLAELLPNMTLLGEYYYVNQFRSRWGLLGRMFPDIGFLVRLTPGMFHVRLADPS